MILDAGVLISIDRRGNTSLQELWVDPGTNIEFHTTAPVVAQVWRDGSRQARLARFLKSCQIHDFVDGRRIGELLAASGTSDVVDAHLVLCAAELGCGVITSDLDDISHLASFVVLRPPQCYIWPPRPQRAPQSQA